MKFAVIKKRNLFIYSALTLSVALLLVAVWSTGAYIVAAGKTTRKLPIYSVDRSDNKVAISFDASWGADSTEGIIKTVEEHGVKATFFAVNLWAEKYPELMKKIADSSAFEVGLHSSTHPHMSKLSKEQIRQEIEGNQSAIERITGKKATLFRPPFGEYTDTVISVCDELNLKTVQWDVDSLDWKGLSSHDIATRIISGAKSGSIILMHNDGEHTLEALPAVINGLKNKGFELVTISELIYHENYQIDHTGKQFQIND